LFTRYRKIPRFSAMFAITGSALATLSALTSAIGPGCFAAEAGRDPRRAWIADERATLTTAWKTALTKPRERARSIPAWVSHGTSLAQRDPRCIVINEYTAYSRNIAASSEGLGISDRDKSPGMGGVGKDGVLGSKIDAPAKPGHGRARLRAHLCSANLPPVHTCSALHGSTGSLCSSSEQMRVGFAVFKAAPLAMYPVGTARPGANEANFVQLGNNCPAFEQIAESAGGYGERCGRSRGRFPARWKRANRS